SELVSEPLQRVAELAVGQDAGTEPEDVVAQIADDTVDLGHRGLDPLLDRGVSGELPRGLEPHPDGEERLDHAVVELLGDTPAILQDGQTLEVLSSPSVSDGDRGLPGERLH